MPFIPNDYLTTSQAAKIFHVSRFTILNWIKQGKLLSVSTLGGHQRIPRKTILIHLSKNRLVKQIRAESSTNPPQRKKVLKRVWQKMAVKSSNAIPLPNKTKINEVLTKKLYQTGRFFAVSEKILSKILT